MMNIWKKKEIIVPVAIAVFIIGLFCIPFIRKGALLLQNNGSIIGEQYPKRLDDPLFPYALTQPSKVFKLPHRLDEISGLSYFEKNQLMCIQDEKGVMYVFDIEKGKVTEKFKFGLGSDYEDIEIVQENAYILQSSGTILKVKSFRNGAPNIEKYNTRLSRKNDAEGLAFDDVSNALLIACKDSPHLKKKRQAMKGTKAVYRFDFDTQNISKEPAFIIDLERLKKFFPGDDVNFHPSGIAIHPHTKDIYLISSPDKMLIVLNRKGHIITAQTLDQKIFRQPEGICFNPEGDLFISNERKKGRATIVKFDYKQKSKEGRF